MLDNDIRIIAERLLDYYEDSYKIYRPRVKMIISNKITDINYIEHTLDGVLDIYTDKGFLLFIELLAYYKNVNYRNARDYLEILKEDREEEYKDFVKRIKKSKDKKKNNK